MEEICALKEEKLNDGCDADEDMSKSPANEAEMSEPPANEVEMSKSPANEAEMSEHEPTADGG